MHLSSFTRHLLAVALFVALLPLLGLAEIQVRGRYLAGRRLLPPEGYALPPAPVLRALTFGHNELGADLLWVRTIAYYADHLLGDRDFRHLARHLNNILALDSRSRHVYRYGAAMLVTQGARRSNTQVFAAIDLLKQAATLYPDDWNYPLYVGVYYIGELRSRSTAQRARWKLEGADWIHRAVLVGSTIPWLPTLAAKLYSEQGKREVAILSLQEVYQTAPNDAVRAQIAAKLKELRAASVADELRRTSRTLEEARRRSPVAFIPEDLFLLVGLPRIEPFSLESITSPPPADLLR